MTGAAGGRRQRGVSIVDLLIAIVIIGILISIVYPRFKSRRGAAGSGAADTVAAAAAPGAGPTAEGGAATTGSPARLAWVTRPGDATMVGDSARLAVRVEDERGRPLSGVPVEFEAAGSGKVSPAAATSDAAGVVPVTWRFGTEPGRVTLTARVRGRPQVTSDVAATLRGAH